MDLHAPVSRSAPPPSRLGHATTSFGSQPDLEMMSRSPPGHQQRQRRHGRRCHQSSSSSTTKFFEADVDDGRHRWPPSSGDRRPVLAPPPYSRDQRADDASPIRLLFSADDDSPFPPLPSPGAAAAAPLAGQPCSPPGSPRRVAALRRQAVSDNSVLSLTSGQSRLIGSRPSDHYFRSVCLSVCLFVCLFVQSFSQPSLIRFRSHLDICCMSGSSCVP